MNSSRQVSGIHKRESKECSKVNILEGVISGHTEPCEGNSISFPWVQWLQRHMQSEKPSEPIPSRLKFRRWGGVIRSPLHSHHSGKKSMWVLSPPKLRSRYETDCMIFIPCEGDFSLVLLVMFSHPYPTLVKSFPHPYSHLEKPIVLVWETWVVSLFRRPHPLKIPVLKINLRKCGSDIRLQYHCHMDELG